MIPRRWRDAFGGWRERLRDPRAELTFYLVLMCLMPLFEQGLRAIAGWVAAAVRLLAQNI